jgi:hypothetical protein
VIFPLCWREHSAFQVINPEFSSPLKMYQVAVGFQFQLVIFTAFHFLPQEIFPFVSRDRNGKYLKNIKSHGTGKVSSRAS